jgi:hypothetical protein
VSAPAPAGELRRVVWRHEHGRLPSGRTALEGLSEEYLRALDELHALEGDRATIRAHAPTLLADHDDALRRARRALEEEALGTALNHLLYARERMEETRELLAAHAALARAAKAVARVRAAARVERLRELPCVHAPGRLLEAARERMAGGCRARAAYLAEACVHQVRALRPGAPADPSRAAALEDSLRETREMCDATRLLLPDTAADPWSGATLDAAAAVAEEGWFVLAERIAEEMRALLAPRARFRRALEQAPEGADAAIAGLRHRLADAPDGDPWTAATRLLWRARVDDTLRRMRQAQEQREPPRGRAEEAGDDVTINPGMYDEQPDL